MVRAWAARDMLMVRYVLRMKDVQFVYTKCFKLRGLNLLTLSSNL